MRSTLSAALQEAMHAQETGQVFLPLATLTQDNWAEEIRIVPNEEPITHLTKEFSPLAFDVALPDEEEEGVPVLQWVADNTDRRLVQALRNVTGAVAVRLVWVLADTPDTIEIGPLDVEMRAAEYDARTISGALGVEPILDMQFGSMAMTPGNTPALF